MFRTSTGLKNVSRRTVTAWLAGAFTGTALSTPSSDRWLIYYSDKEPPSAFDPFSTIIFDSRYHPPLAPLAATGKQLIGYLSIGEASPDYSYFGQLQADGMLLRPNPIWAGNLTIDIRDSRWTMRLCDKIIAPILERGFHGLFLDTMDSALFLEEQDPQRYGGMGAAAKDLIRTSRRRYPKVSIALNRGYSLLDGIADQLDIVVGESVYTTYDFDKRQYLLVDQQAYRRQVQILRAAARKNPRLRIFTLDYWSPEDVDGIRRIYSEQRGNDFVPYVTSIDLIRIVNEPG